MSMRITNSMVARTVLNDLTAVSGRLTATQRKLSSGRELGRPSDDPFRTARALELRKDLEASRQHQDNVREALAWQTVSDTALGKVTDAVQRARELVVQGSNDTAGATARSNLAQEVTALIDSIKQEANASYSGRFVFSGTLTTTRPYTVGGVDTFAGNAASISREIGPGVSIPINQIGSTVLGNGAGADTLLLDTLRDVVTHLQGGTPADLNILRTTDLQQLDANLDLLSSVRAAVGATTNRLDTAALRLAELEESTLSLLSETEDADMAKTMVDFSMQQAVYQSALKSGANIVQVSLLDFLR